MNVQSKIVTEWNSSDYSCMQERLAKARQTPQSATIFIDTDNINNANTLADIFMLFGAKDMHYVLAGNREQYNPDFWKTPLLEKLQGVYDISEYKVPQLPDAADLGLLMKLGEEIAVYGSNRSYIVISTDTIFQRTRDIMGSLYSNIRYQWMNPTYFMQYKIDCLESKGIQQKIAEYERIHTEGLTADAGKEMTPTRTRRPKRPAEVIAAEKAAKQAAREAKQLASRTVSSKLSEPETMDSAARVGSDYACATPQLSARTRAIQDIRQCMSEQAAVTSYVIDLHDSLVRPVH